MTTTSDARKRLAEAELERQAREGWADVDPEPRHEMPCEGTE